MGLNNIHGLMGASIEFGCEYRVEDRVETYHGILYGFCWTGRGGSIMQKRMTTVVSDARCAYESTYEERIHAVAGRMPLAYEREMPFQYNPQDWESLGGPQEATQECWRR